MARKGRVSGKWGSIDFSSISDFGEKLEKLGDGSGGGRNVFFEAAARGLAARLLELVIPRTPVGTGETAGTLRRGWTGGADVQVEQFVEGISIEKSGASYIITIANEVDYALYVEHGHRQTPGRYVPAIGKRLKAGWAEGAHMLEISMNELNGVSHNILSGMLEDWLNGVFT